MESLFGSSVSFFSSPVKVVQPLQAAQTELRKTDGFQVQLEYIPVKLTKKNISFIKMKYIFLNALCSIAILVYQSVNKAAEKKNCKFLPSISSNTFRSMGNKIDELENSMVFEFKGNLSALTTPQALFGKSILKNLNLPCYQYLNFHMQLCTNGWQHYIQ